MPIYLEFAPDGFIDPTAEEKQEEEPDSGAERRAATVFVKNLNFKTTEVHLEELFTEAVRNGKILSVKIVRNKDNQNSRGYGFVEFDSEDAASKAVKKLQNTVVDDHALKLSLAQRQSTIEKAEQAAKKSKVIKDRKDDAGNADDEDAQTNKLLVKNLAFEATPADVRALFK